MFQTNKYYAHSGAIGLAGPIYMLLLGVVAALILGAIYGYAIYYIPFIYLNFFITIFFGAGVGFLVGKGGEWGKVRNSKALLLFGFLMGCVAEYIGWVSWIFAFSEQEALLLVPSDMLSAIHVVAENGAWSMFGWTPTGTASYAIWVIEAILIVGSSTAVAWVALSSTPFCEHCKKWIEEEDAIGPLEFTEDPHELKSQLEQGDHTLLKSMKEKDPDDDVYTKVTLLHCPDCQQNHFLTLQSVAVCLDSDNKEQTKEDDILENLIITAAQYKMLKEQW